MLIAQLRRASRRRGLIRPRCCCPGPPGCHVTVCAVGCPGGAALVGAGVVLKQGGTTVASGTTDATGCVRLVIPADGTYEVAVTAGSYHPFDGARAIACGDTITIRLQPSTQTQGTVGITVQGCCGRPVQGATVALSDGQSCTTDASGSCSFWLGDAGTYTITIAADRYTTFTDVFTFGSVCPSVGGYARTVQLDPADGFACGPHPNGAAVACRPIPVSLSLTDSVYGGCTLTYNPGTNNWTGSLTGTTSQPHCPTTSVTLNYSLAACGTELSGVLGITGGTINCGTCNSQDVFVGTGVAGSFFMAPSDPLPYPCGHGVIGGTVAGCPTPGLTCNTPGSASSGGACSPCTVACSPFQVTMTQPAGTCSTSTFWPAGVTLTLTE